MKAERTHPTTPKRLSGGVSLREDRVPVRTHPRADMARTRGKPPVRRVQSKLDIASKGGKSRAHGASRTTGALPEGQEAEEGAVGGRGRLRRRRGPPEQAADINPTAVVPPPYKTCGQACLEGMERPEDIKKGPEAETGAARRACVSGRGLVGSGIDIEGGWLQRLIDQSRLPGRLGSSEASFSGPGPDERRVGMCPRAARRI